MSCYANAAFMRIVATYSTAYMLCNCLAKDTHILTRMLLAQSPSPPGVL